MSSPTTPRNAPPVRFTDPTAATLPGTFTATPSPPGRDQPVGSNATGVIGFDETIAGTGAAPATVGHSAGEPTQVEGGAGRVIKSTMVSSAKETMPGVGGANRSYTGGAVTVSNSPSLPLSVRSSQSVSLPINESILNTLSPEPTSLAVLPEVKLSGGTAEVTTTAQPRYELVRELGEGAVGSVELVYDRDISRQVARKRLKATIHTPSNLARFIEEIQAVGALEHPGIAPIHDVGVDEHGYFFTMKYVQGETLETILDALRENNPQYLSKYSLDTRVGMFEQILRTMNFAHAQGVVHRDIKPANIIVGKYGEVLMMDWGVAKRVGTQGNTDQSQQGAAIGADLTAVQIDQQPGVDAFGATAVGATQATASRVFTTAVGTLVGSPGYMSPEQAGGRNDLVDFRSDIYALSVLFFEMLSLRHYLDHLNDLNAVLHAIVNTEPVSAIGMHHQYGIPPEYTFYIRKGLEKDPNKRFQTIGEMIEGLQRIEDGNVPVQCPCTGLKRAGGAYGSFIDRHPIGGVVSAIVMSALSVYGGVQLVMQLAGLRP